MVEEPQYHNMAGKPLFDILLKLPLKSLLRLRCVLKLWREYIDDSYFVSIHDKQVDPTPIMFYFPRTSEQENPLFFHKIESGTFTNHVLKAKNKVGVIEFGGKINQTSRIVGSCNGLVLIKIYDDQNFTTNFIAIHPINKECYVLPKLPLRFNNLVDRDTGGLGFDSSTNTFQFLCVYLNPNYPNDHCPMVHVFGTNSWHQLPQVPSYRISGKAVSAHGCLHWLSSYNGEDDVRQVIWFDVKNVDFGLIKPPKTISKPSKRKLNHHFSDHLVILDRQVGYFVNKTTEVWVLNHKKEWVLHCSFEDHDFPDGYLEVCGCLNKAGDILIKLTKRGRGKEIFYVYNLKNRVIHEARIDGLDLENGSLMDIVMFPNSLCDNITNSNLFRKRA